YLGDAATGRALLLESLDARRRLGDPTWLAWVPMLLGQIEHAEGNHAAARACYEECLAIWRARDYRVGMAEALPARGELALDEGGVAAGGAVLRGGLELGHALGNWWGVELALEGLAGLAEAQGRPEHALRLGGAAAGLRLTTGERCPPDVAARVGRRLQRARERLGVGAAEAAWAEGAALTPEEAVAHALRATPGAGTGAAGTSRGGDPR